MDTLPTPANPTPSGERPAGVNPEELKTGAPEQMKPAAEAAPAPASSPANTPAPAATPPALSATDVAAAIAAVPAPAGAMPTPTAAGDVDVIEPEWVDKAEEVVKAHQGDPYGEEEAIEDLQKDYLSKRYGHNVADPDNSKPEGT
jgi:hypothetical protein